MTRSSIKTACDAVQGKSRLATAIGVSAVTVHQWCDGSRPIPSARCPSIERASGGAVTCEELLPHLVWHRIPDAAWPHPLGRPVLDFCPPVQAASPSHSAIEKEVSHG